MIQISRRSLNIGLIAAATAADVRGRLAFADDLDVTRHLPRKFAGKTLRMMTGNDPVTMALARYSSRFTDATGAHIDFSYSGSNDRYQKMVLDLTSRANSFDVYTLAYQWKYEVAPYLADLSNIETDVKGAPPLDLADYPERALDVYGKFEGRLKALPLLGSTTFLVWNKKAYRAAGLDPEASPADWQQVYDNARKLTHGKQYGFNLPAGKGDQCMCLWIVLFHSFGGKYFGPDGRPQFDTAPAIETMRFMANNLRSVSPPDDLTWDFPEMVNSFVTGEAAQGFMWPGGFSTISDPTKSVVAGHTGMRPTPGAVLLGGWSLAVNARSPNLELAKLYVAWLTSKQVSTQTAAFTGQPVRISAFTNPALIAKFPQYPMVLAALLGPVVQFVPIKEAQQIHIMIFNQANAACAGTKTPEQAAKDLQEQATRFMIRRGYLKT
jgi:ABC-type glycerol-3-phosphate transport system substrate-binding protein